MAVLFDSILRKLRQGGAIGGAMAIEGQWNANTNTPDISGTTATGSFWIVSVAGSTNVGGITDWQVSDWVIKTTTGWMKVDNSDVGNMLKATYDPTSVSGDTFDMDNMVEGDTKLILSSAERTNISNSVTHAGLTTTAHGGLVASNDSRLTDARTPTAHAGTHATGQADAIAAGDIGAEVAGSAATVQGNLNTHTGLTTTAHGGIVASSDARLTDARTPTAHAATHASGQADEITVTKSQVGLGSVDNVQQMPLSYLDTDNTLAADSDTKVASQKAVNVFVRAKFNPSICLGRATLERSVAVSTTNQTAKTVLYFTDFNGGLVSLYNGSSWDLYEINDQELDLSGLATGTNFDLWGYPNSGELVLDKTAWSNDTTRATALTKQDGIYVKDGDTTRRLLGVFRTSAEGQCTDSLNQRFVWNMYNRVPRAGRSVNANASWSHTTAATREYNAGTGQTRFEFILGLVGLSDVTANTSSVVTGNTAAMYLGLALDSDSALNYVYSKFNSGATLGYTVYAASGINIAQGYHYMTQVEKGGENATVHGSGYPANFNIPM